MRLISEKMESKLETQEQAFSHMADVRSACDLLESALRMQFAQLAKGMLANLTLQQKNIDTNVLWEQYQSINGLAPSPVQPKSPDFLDFRRQFARSVAVGQVPVVNEGLLGKIEIRMYGGYRKLWDDVSINRQLSKMRSDFRLLCLGAPALTVNRLSDLLNRPDKPLPVDRRFIFGRVGTITATPEAELFDFVEEAASSPHLEPLSHAFTYRSRIVIRRPVIRRLGLEQSSTWLGALIHETIHIIPLVLQDGARFLRNAWLEHVEEDLCRFLQQPRDKKELADAFKWSFDRSIVEHALERVDIGVPGKLEWTLDRILQRLVFLQRVQCIDNDTYQAASFKSGMGWLV